MTEAEKEFQQADIANAKARAIELQAWVAEYKNALQRVQDAKKTLKGVIECAKDKGFSKDMLHAVLTSQSIRGVDKLALLDVVAETTQETGVEICAE